MNPTMNKPDPNANPEFSAKLQNVKYTSILPSGKLQDYVGGDKVTFDIPPSIPYFDGSQSYISIQVSNDSSYTGNVQDGSATYNGKCPLAFPPNMGANALINRLQINDMKGQSLENLEAYNLYNSLYNAYCNDVDVYGALAKVEGVGARNNDERNMRSDDPKVNYFQQVSTSINAGTELVATNEECERSTTFCIPVMSGLFGFFQGEQNAYPNLDIGGTRMELYLEEANNIMNVLSSSYPVTRTLGGQAYTDIETRRLTDTVGLEAVGGGLDAGQTTQVSIIQQVNGLPIDTTIATFSGNEAWRIEMLGWRIGQIVRIRGGTLAAGGELATITAVKSNEGAGNNRIRIEHTAVSQADGTTIELDNSVVRKYNISKIELKLLETTPDSATMGAIRRAMSNGVNFTSYQLNKISSPAGLVNSVLDIPTPLTRGLSIMCVPVQSANLNSQDSDNSYVWCRPDSVLNANNNNYSYIWQVGNTLIPNREVDTNSAVNNADDNSIYYLQQAQAFRPLRPLKAFGDIKLQTSNQLNNAYFFPLLVAPVGNSYNLSETEVQLRITNSDNTGADVSAKLNFVFLNHVRKMTANDGGVQIQL